MQAAIDDDFHHSERQCRIGAGPRLDMPVRKCSGPRHARIDGDDPCAVVARRIHERHRMHAGRDQIRAPQDHDFHVRQIFDVGVAHAAERMHFGRGAGCGTNRALEARGAHLVEEALAHAEKSEHAQRTGIGERLDRLSAVLCYHGLEVRRDFAERLVPTDALEFRFRSLRTDAPMRIKHALVVVNQIQIVIDLAAQVTARDRVGRIPLNLDCPPGGIIHGHPHGTAVGTIVRTGDAHCPLFAGNARFTDYAHDCLARNNILGYCNAPAVPAA